VRAGGTWSECKGPKKTQQAARAQKAIPTARPVRSPSKNGMRVEEPQWYGQENELEATARKSNTCKTLSMNLERKIRNGIQRY
jgi:hypothetical protein